MMKKILVLVTCVSWLTACSVLPEKPPAPDPLFCQPQYPKPLTLTPLRADVHFVILEDKVELTHAGWAIVIAWMHEAERFSIDAVNLQAFMERCITNYNESLKRLTGPPEAEAKWYEFWK